MVAVLHWRRYPVSCSRNALICASLLIGRALAFGAGLRARGGALLPVLRVVVSPIRRGFEKPARSRAAIANRGCRQAARHDTRRNLTHPAWRALIENTCAWSAGFRSPFRRLVTSQGDAALRCPRHPLFALYLALRESFNVRNAVPKHPVGGSEIRRGFRKPAVLKQFSL
jgi:hypothetical protein